MEGLAECLETFPGPCHSVTPPPPPSPATALPQEAGAQGLQHPHSSPFLTPPHSSLILALLLTPNFPLPQPLLSPLLNLTLK